MLEIAHGLGMDGDRLAQVLPEAISGLTWPFPGWPPGMELEVSRVLLEATRVADITWEDVQGSGRDLRRGTWVQLFHVSELLGREERGDLAVEHWATRPIRTPPFSRINPLFFMLRLHAEAEIHNTDSGWHLHPTEKGKHLGYRLFFDASRSQQELAWERHGEGALPWGEPPLKVLRRSTATALHDACLAAVRRKSTLAPKRRPFSEWAAMFGRPSAGKAYVAHPPVSVPTPW